MYKGAGDFARGLQKKAVLKALFGVFLPLVF
jgi:hypothetical protein